jgi:prepilin-type processing-associated H-X9-DG protein
MIAIGDAKGPRLRVISPIAVTRATPSQRHKTRANILFCDGHVESLKEKALIESSNEVRRRWNNDNEPHPETWYWWAKQKKGFPEIARAVESIRSDMGASTRQTGRSGHARGFTKATDSAFYESPSRRTTICEPGATGTTTTSRIRKLGIGRPSRKRASRKSRVQ